MSKNDDRILELKEQIKAKRSVLENKKVRFAPETNCVLELNGIKYNLNVCTEESLIMLLIRLNTYVMSAKDLHIEVPMLSGYTVDMWIGDIKSKLAALTWKSEENDLKKMECKLNKLLSEDKKTELELDAIANELTRLN